MKKTSILTRLLCLVLCLLLAASGCRAPEPDNTATGSPDPDNTATGTVPDDVPVNYTITVTNEAGMGIADLGIYIYEDETLTELQDFRRTDERGVMTFSAAAGRTFTAVLQDTPAGCVVLESYPITGQDTVITLTADRDSEVPLTEVNYKLGDTVYNFALTDGEGNEYTLYGLLAEKNAVVLNFWYTACDPCRSEFPHLQAAWEQYSDDVAVLCLNPTGESAEAVAAFADEMGITMPIMACDRAWTSAMGIVEYPTTVVIDRYGTVCMIHDGTVTDPGVFEGVFAHFGAEVYEQRIITDIHELAVEPAPGDEDPMANNPTEVGGVTSFEVTVVPGGTWSLDLYKAGGMILQIKDPTAEVDYKGETYTAKNGTVTVWLGAVDVMEAADLTFRNTGDEVAVYTVRLSFPAGTHGNPYSLKLGDLTTNLAAGNDQGVYYTITATKTGTLSITLQEITAGVKCDYVLYNLTSFAYRNLSTDGTDGAEGDPVLSVPVKAGDRVQLIISAVPDSSFNYPAATVKSTVSFTAGEAGSDEPDEPDDITYTVTVTDDHGQPVAGVYLSVAGLEQPLVTATDAGGKITFLAPAGTYPVTLTVPEGYTADRTVFEVSGENPEITAVITEIVIVMKDYTVTVTDHTGAPLAGVTLAVGDAMAATDAAGKALFRLEEGTYTVSLSVPEGYTSEKGSDIPFAANSTALSVVLTKLADYTVSVVDQSGAPMAGVPITVGSSSGVTNAAGSYTVTLKDGSYVVGITVPEGYVSEGGNSFTFGDERTLSVTLTKLVDYSLTVTDQDGKAMAGLAVTIGTVTGLTDARGAFTASLTWGSYTASVLVPDQYTAPAGSSLTLTAEKPAAAMALEKVIELADYTVSVIDRDGAPIAGVTVTVGGVSGVTDAAGRFTVNLEKGSYTATVALPAGYTSVSGTTFPFAGGSNSLTVTLDKVIEKVNYTVTVTDESGIPMAGVAVAVGGVSGATDAMGRFTATLDEGSYTATLTLPDKYTSAAGTVFALTPEAPSVSVTLTRVIEKIDYSVTVLDHTGKAMAGVSVTIGTAAGTTDAAGRFAATLNEGSYTAVVTLPENCTATGTTFELTAGEPAASVTLTRMADYSVTVADSTGKAMEGVFVSIGNASGRTGTDGIFKVRLKEGSYAATMVLPEGYTSVAGSSFTLTAASPAVKVTLTSTAPATETYTVKVTDYFGAPKPNVAVRFLQSGSSMVLVSADANGVATAQLTPGDYTASLIFSDGGSYYYDTKLGALTADKTSVTIPVVPKISTANPDTIYVGGVSHSTYAVNTGAVYTSLVAGTVNYFHFNPAVSGRYKVSVAGAATVGYYGMPSYVHSQNQAEMDGNSFYLNVKENNLGATYILGASSGESDSGCILIISRVGDAVLDATDQPWTVYVPSMKPTPYTLELSAGQTLMAFDITAETGRYNLVKDAEGYYHLGSQSGPLVLVELGSGSPYVSFVTLMQTAHAGKYFYDANGNFVKKESYTQCLDDYIECMDSKHGVYPLTDDLIYIYKEYGEAAGWYRAEGIVGETAGANKDILWMFALCWVE